MGWKKHYRLVKVASNLVKVAGEKLSPTSTDNRPGKITFKAARSDCMGFCPMLRPKGTGTRVASLLLGLESFLDQ